MNIHKELKLLGNQFALYGPLWQHWIKTNLHSLTTQEIKTIAAHSRFNFEIKDLSGMQAAFLDEKTIHGITKKLKRDLREFKNWVLREFQFEIINQAKKNNWELFYLRPIDKLPLNKKVLQCLEAFGTYNLEDLFNTYTEKDLMQGENFEKVFAALELIYQVRNGGVKRAV